MHEASWMIMLTKENGLRDEIEYKPYFLSKDNKTVYRGSIKNKLFSIQDITNVSMLEDEMLEHFKNILNIKGVSIVGLRSLMFFIDFKENNGKKHRLYVVGESHQMSYIWFQGLQNLCRNSSKPVVIASLPLIVSNHLRIGQKNLYQSIKNIFNKSNDNPQQASKNGNNDNKNNNDNCNDENQYKQKEDKIPSIEKDCSLISKHVNDLYSFACRTCILDSTEHLTLLSQAMNLKKINEEIQVLINQIKNNNNSNTNDISKYDYQIKLIEALHCQLHSVCTVVALKWYNMQNDIQLSRQ